MSEICEYCDDNEMPLWCAILFNHLQCAETLIDSDGWDGDAIYTWNYLHQVASHGYEEMIDLLLKKGANVNVECNLRRTPFCYAIDRGHDSCARKLMLEYGADTGICCTKHKQMTSIWVLCSAGKTKRIGSRSAIRRLPQDLLKMVYGMLEL